MPGIVAIFTKMPAEFAGDQLTRMIGTLRHERFYTSGSWSDKTSGVYVGWVARPNSFLDKTPVKNETGDIVLAFSGEEFPEPETKQRLKERGHEFDETGPAYLAHLYEDDRLFPLGLNGRFHGVIFDRNLGTVMVFNDRYGMHRIYFHESRDAFYFASEVKAILAVCPELRRIDSRGLGEFISSGVVLENRTLFHDILALPPASAWVFRNGTIERKGTYFDPREWEDQGELAQEDYYKDLRATFTRNLARYFSGGDKIAMSLTGGLDTRMIFASRNFAPGALPCYTFGSMFRENHDVRVAKKVADVCEQPFQVIVPGQEFLSEFPKYAERTVYLTEGRVDVGRSPDLYLNERAREIAPVRMTGNYGGEMLRGVQAFKPEDPMLGLFSPEVLGSVKQATQTYAEIRRGHPITFAAFKQAPWYQQGVLGLEETQLTMRSPYLDNDFVRTVYRSPRAALASNDVSLRLVADGNRKLSKILTDRGVGGQSRVAAATSHALLEFMFKAEYAYDMGMPQWLARLDHSLSRLQLQRLFLGRHKVFHFRVWYQDALAGYVQEILLDSRSLSRPYIEGKRMESVVRGHLKGDRNYTTDLHKLLTLEILHRQFFDTQEVNRGRQELTTPSSADHLATA